jgi:hypothetical protein
MVRGRFLLAYVPSADEVPGQHFLAVDDAERMFRYRGDAEHNAKMENVLDKTNGAAGQRLGA